MNEAQQLLARFGLTGRPDLNRFSVDRPRSQEHLDALRHAAHDPYTGGPGTDAWLAYHAVLQQELDADLPSLRNGAVPRSIADQEADLADVAIATQQHFVDPDPLLRQYQLNGVDLADLPVEQVRNWISNEMATALPHQRQLLADLHGAIENSGASSMGISWEHDSERLTWETPSTVESDAYVNYRQAQQRVRTGIEALQVAKGDTDALLYSGTSPDGLSYDSYSDASRGGGDA